MTATESNESHRSWVDTHTGLNMFCIASFLYHCRVFCGKGVGANFCGLMLYMPFFFFFFWYDVRPSERIHVLIM